MKEIRKCLEYLEAEDYKKAIKFGKKAIKLYPEDVEAYACLGEAYFMEGQIDLAIENFKKTENCLKRKYEQRAKLLSGIFEIQDFKERDFNLMILYKRLGDAYKQKMDLETALYYYNESLSLARDLKFTKSEKDALLNIADIFYYKGEMEKTLKYLEEALIIEEDEKEKIYTYNLIAYIYFKEKEYNKTIEYLKKVIEISEKYEDHIESGKAMLSLAGVYREIKDYENTKYYLSEGLKRIQKTGDKYWLGLFLRYFGWYFMDKGDIKSAREHLNKAYEILKSIGAEEEASEVVEDLVELEGK
jgi:tetratricopeptide (TPR) repeat protein